MHSVPKQRNISIAFDSVEPMSSTFVWTSIHFILLYKPLLCLWQLNYMNWNIFNLFFGFALFANKNKNSDIIVRFNRF